jgi:hypothetical protein
VSEIRRVPTAGGRPERVDDGFGPRVSPDGSGLAYFQEVKEGLLDLVLRDLSTGEDRIVIGMIDCDCDALMSWEPSGRNLLVQTVSCGCGGRSYMDMELVDISTGSRAKLPVPAAIDMNAAWGSPTFLPDGNLFLLEAPDNRWDQSGNPVKNGTPRMLVVNPRTSKVVRVITTGFGDRTYSSTDSDASGKYLTYLSNNKVMVSDHGQRPAQLAAGVSSVDW